MYHMLVHFHNFKKELHSMYKIIIKNVYHVKIPFQKRDLKKLFGHFLKAIILDNEIKSLVSGVIGPWQTFDFPSTNLPLQLFSWEEKVRFLIFHSWRAWQVTDLEEIALKWGTSSGLRDRWFLFFLISREYLSSSCLFLSIFLSLKISISAIIKGSYF